MGTIKWRHSEPTDTPEPKRDEDQGGFTADDTPEGKRAIAKLDLAKQLAEELEGEMVALIGRSDDPDSVYPVICFIETGRVITVKIPVDAESLDDLGDEADEYNSGLVLYSSLSGNELSDVGRKALRAALMQFDRAYTMQLVAGWLKDAAAQASK